MRILFKLPKRSTLLKLTSIVLFFCSQLTACAAAEPEFVERVAVATITPSFTLVPTHTASSTPTSTPTKTMTPSLTPTFGPPYGHVQLKSNLLGNPHSNIDDFVGTLCKGDELVYLSEQLVNDKLWYKVQVLAKNPTDCADQRIKLDSVGWVRNLYISNPSDPLEGYLSAIGEQAPTPLQITIIPTKTATKVPTPTTIKLYESRTRIGARCRDGSRSSATGRGACSHHGGVSEWIYR